MKIDSYFIIDFDSTFVQIESLDELAKIALRKRKDKNKVLKKIKNTTNLGMEGKIPFRESLSIRLKLFRANKNHIEELIKILKRKITPSVIRNKKNFKINSNRIYIISGGFKEYVFPVVKEFGIKEKNILTNSFIFDENGNISGFDKNNPLSKSNGKTEIIKSLKLKGIINIIGDGYTDYIVKEKGIANKFFAFTENVKREKVMQKADFILSDFDRIFIKNDRKDNKKHT